MTKPIISFVVLVLSIGFTFFYVVPAYNLNVERRGDIESLSKILSTSSEIRTLIDETKTNLGLIDPTGLASFEVFLPEKIDQIRFANNIQYIGRKNGIILSDIKVEGATNGTMGSGSNGLSATQGLVNALSIGSKIDQAQGATAQNIQGVNDTVGKRFVTTKASFSFTATYETFQLLLYDLEKSLGVIDLTDLSFVQAQEVTGPAKSKTSSAPMYKYTMAIETYSLK